MHCTRSAICIIITYNLSSNRIILSVKKVFSRRTRLHYIAFTIYVVRIIAFAYDVCVCLLRVYVDVYICACVCTYMRLYVYNSYKLG